jgi:hypothetical protein
VLYIGTTIETRGGMSKSKQVRAMAQAAVPSADAGARSGAGTRRSKTAFCSRTTTCPVEAQVARFVEHYNHRRSHESLKNLTPADVYVGKGHTILLQRERIKRDTIKHRQLQHRLKAA